MIRHVLTSIGLAFAIATSAHAQATVDPGKHWVFIRTYDRPGVSAEEDKGRSKEGDIVVITPAYIGESPTPTEQSSYRIITVSGLTRQDISILTEAPPDDDGKDDGADGLVAFRTEEFDFIGFPRTPGFNPNPIPKVAFMARMRVKTSLVYTRYAMKQKFYAYVQRPMIRIGNVITRRAFAATDTKKICATGSNCTDEDYNTTQAWEDDNDGDLVTATTIEKGEVYDDDGDVAGQVIINGSTTSSLYFMWLTSNSGEYHGGIQNTAATITHSADPVECLDNWTRLSHLEAQRTSGSGPILDFNSTNCDSFAVDHMLLYDNTSCNTGSGCGITTRWGIVANTFFDNNGGANERAATDWGSGDITYFINNTVYLCDKGFDVDGTGGNVYSYNNWFDDDDSGQDDMGTCNGGSHNACRKDPGDCDSDASCSTGAVLGCAMSGNVTSLGTDHHLDSGASCVIDAGTDLGTTYAQAEAEQDVDLRDRDAEGDTWDIGYDEFVAAGTTGPININGDIKITGDLKLTKRSSKSIIDDAPNKQARRMLEDWAKRGVF